MWYAVSDVNPAEGCLVCVDVLVVVVFVVVVVVWLSSG